MKNMVDVRCLIVSSLSECGYQLLQDINSDRETHVRGVRAGSGDAFEEET